MTQEEFRTLKEGDILSTKYKTHEGLVCGYDYLVISDYKWDAVEQTGYIICGAILDNDDNSTYQKHCGKQFVIYETDLIHILTHRNNYEKSKI